MKGCVIFVRGSYRRDSLSFYKKLCRGKYLVAANGGSAFFKKSGKIPHLIIGDLDSATSLAQITGPKTKLIRHSPRKDKTDSALALEYCLSAGFSEIDIAMPSFGEPDHFLGTLLLPTQRKLVQKHKNSKVRIISHKFESRFLCDDSLTITGGNGDTLSIFPLSERVWLTCSGTEYIATDLLLTPGQTAGLRNRIRSNRACLSVRGKALVIRQFRR